MKLGLGSHKKNTNDLIASPQWGWQIEIYIIL